MESTERRKSVRIIKENTFTFQKIQDGNANPRIIVGMMIDYSIAGLRFVTDEPLEKNTSLVIQLDLEALSGDKVDWKNIWETGDATSLNIIGSVMWCLASTKDSNVFEVGTRFIQKASKQ